MHQFGQLGRQIMESGRSEHLLSEALQWLLFLVGLLFSILGWSDFFTMGGASSLMAMVIPTVLVVPLLHEPFCRLYQGFPQRQFRYLRRHDSFLRMAVCLAMGIALIGVYQDPRPRVSQLNLCATVGAAGCTQTQTDFTALQVPQLYATARVHPPQWGAHVKLQVMYTPEPGRSEAIVNHTIAPDRQDDRIQIALPLKLPLAVGKYQVTLTPLGQDTRSGTQSFNLWPEDQDLAQRQTLKQDPIFVQKVTLCDRRDCVQNLNKFPSTVETLVFRVNFAGSTQPVPISFKLYQDNPKTGPKMLHETTKTVEAQLTELNYSLHVRGSLPPGNYTELIALETANAQPILKHFSVEPPRS